MYTRNDTANNKWSVSGWATLLAGRPFSPTRRSNTPFLLMLDVTNKAGRDTNDGQVGPTRPPAAASSQTRQHWSKFCSYATENEKNTAHATTTVHPWACSPPFVPHWPLRSARRARGVGRSAQLGVPPLGGSPATSPVRSCVQGRPLEYETPHPFPRHSAVLARPPALSAPEGVHRRETSTRPAWATRSNTPGTTVPYRSICPPRREYSRKGPATVDHGRPRPQPEFPRTPPNRCPYRQLVVQAKVDSRTRGLVPP